ncbi:MAG: hypothetical protein EOT05_00675 [Candidatus Microsaccharimonas sossegonensis]|uniref:Uncharacterized protein n=1 Tax=Candidatus Microsaccharimonas sossegonensis TaxID=2506948 RepID=A0A4Q0AH07_9BACT|nr:MAG: hypothetical protein EOT05_00675 [Candidatus Microsaccharimonas sossegonensis]
MKKGKKMNAVTTRNVLATTLVIVIISSAVGFYLGLQYIQSYALEVTTAVTNSRANKNDTGALSQLQQQLSAGQGLVAKADAIFSTPATYQTQALKDISKYASTAGISIASIDSAPPGTVTTTKPTYSEIITIQSPVSYAKFLQFLDAVEGNLPKMQITSISIGRPKVPSGDMITTDKITLTVVTR